MPDLGFKPLQKMQINPTVAAAAPLPPRPPGLPRPKAAPAAQAHARGEESALCRFGPWDSCRSFHVEAMSKLMMDRQTTGFSWKSSNEGRWKTCWQTTTRMQRTTRVRH